GEKADLWDIANTCYDDGGKIVDQARALWLQLYDQYMMQAECVEGRQADEEQSSFNKAESGSVYLYPNPASGILSIVLNNVPEQSTELQIFDLRGREMPQNTIRSLGDDVITLDIKDYLEGMYIVRLKSANQTISHKLIVVRR
ncbi:MAG TPA: T9SS type A sorting domain-containing protein, partial [Saprospiraceae bacterium]|nr:T9SS type A sorting domain-containing protein [Saprospiraceae bacterium]HMX86834.1 T9SS type A sorting domain-containing protein [Saprospiraceae bacterium]HMZ74519.1 T9SS type A sorting domain-containing protein [Saprospiraceae bacterium]HNA42671.1 T9SS type A sorting domain-containing protein [Saprospiraceae bacterium]HNA95240.1 T9SS type A sorting domain-containing protein [Saprospiraceae bacterium]